MRDGWQGSYTEVGGGINTNPEWLRSRERGNGEGGNILIARAGDEVRRKLWWVISSRSRNRDGDTTGV